MGYVRLKICCVFAGYDLSPTISIQKCIYTNFRINLTPFYINFSRHEHHDRTFMGRDQELKILAFSLYTRSLSFFLYSPFKIDGYFAKSNFILFNKSILSKKTKFFVNFLDTRKIHHHFMKSSSDGKPRFYIFFAMH